MSKKNTTFSGPVFINQAISGAKSISEIINRVLEMHNITASALAEYLGVSVGQMNKLTTGKVDNPSTIQALKLAKNFGIDLSKLEYAIPADTFQKIKNDIANDPNHYSDYKNQIMCYVDLKAQNFSNMCDQLVKQFINKTKSVLSESCNFNYDYKIKILENSDLNQAAIKIDYSFLAKIDDLSQRKNYTHYIIMMLLEPRLIKQNNYDCWDADIKDFSSKFLYLLSSADLSEKNNIEDYQFVTTSKKTYQKIKNIFCNSNILSDLDVKLTLFNPKTFEIEDFFILSKNQNRTI